MSDSSHPARDSHFLLRDLPMSMGLALLITSPYFLDKVRGNDYYVFDILEYFLISHMQALGVLGLLIYLIILVSRQCGLKSRRLMILISVLFLIFVFRGFFSMAGITPQDLAVTLYGWLSFLGQDRLDPVTLKRVGVSALFGLGLLVLPWVVRDTAPFFRACSAFGWALGVVTIFRVVPIMATDADFSSIRQQMVRSDESTTAVEKRVVWVIFDEFDYHRLFENRNPNLALPNLDRLQHEAVSAVSAVSPAFSTVVSIPALVTGTYLTGTKPGAARSLLLKRQNAVDIEWGKTSTVFSRLKDSGKKVSILGFLHPYCSVFPYANPCLSHPASSYQVWWWGIWQGLRAIPGVDLFSRRYKWTYEAYNQATRVQLEELERHLSDKSTTLSFIHFDIPHLPGGRVQGVTLTKAIEALPGYEQNALTVDWTVGKIIESLEAKSRSQDILLIVSSDHWLRTKLMSANLSPDQIKWEFGNDLAEVRKIPLLIRRMRETSEYVILKPISTVHTARLIEDFLAGRVTDHASIAAWWLDKPYVEPMIPEENRAM